MRNNAWIHKNVFMKKNNFYIYFMSKKCYIWFKNSTSYVKILRMAKIGFVCLRL